MAPGDYCSDTCGCETPCRTAREAALESWRERGLEPTANERRAVQAADYGDAAGCGGGAAHTSIYAMFDALDDSAVAREVSGPMTLVSERAIAGLKAMAAGQPVLRKFDSGAVRDSDADGTRYDLIAPLALERVAATYAEGAVKYSDWNWRAGMDFQTTANHALRHVFKWLARDTSEDHLAHAAWGLLALMQFEAEGRTELDNRYRREA